MSLLRLLTTGKSLVGMSDSESRYRMRARLPHFGSERNPFASRGEAASGPEAETPARAELSSAEHTAARLKETQRLPGPTVAPRGDLRPSWNARLARSIVALIRKLRPSRAARPGIRPLPPAARPGIRPPVQGELRLDNVRVVRNDLSDADLEIVVTATQPAPEPAPAVRPQEELVTSRSA
ncbi:MAG: hypothetical protein U1F98_15250 [Verrucomicrobiota bacterium]